LTLAFLLSALTHNGKAVCIHLLLQVQALLHAKLVTAVVGHVGLEAAFLVLVDFVVALNLLLLALQVLDAVCDLFNSLTRVLLLPQGSVHKLSLAVLLKNCVGMIKRVFVETM
jgi:hypothetical protein